MRQQSFASPEEALAHFGVKGMKWGVRNERDRSTESAALRKQSAQAFQNYTWSRTKDELIFRTMSDQEYNALTTKGREFTVGHEFRRVGIDPKMELQGATFVSHLRDDSTFYRAAIPVSGTQTKMTAAGAKEYRTTHYEATFRSTQKLSSPSEKERVDAFIELLHEPAIYQKGKNAPITGRQYLEHGRFGKFLYRNYSDKQVALKEWYDFTQSQGNRDNPLAQAYFKKLQQRGYGVIPDTNDAGRYTRDSVIVLDPKSLDRVRVHRLTTDEINRAQRELRP